MNQNSFNNNNSSTDEISTTSFADRILSALHEDLRPYFSSSEYGYWVRSHYVIMSVSDESAVASINSMYSGRKEYSAKLLSERDYGKYLMSIERPYRLNAFFEFAFRVYHQSPTDFFELTAELYCDSFSISNNQEAWLDLLLQPRKGVNRLMSVEERKLFRELDNELTIYRGFNASSGNPYGLSWTLDYNIASEYSRGHFKVQDSSPCIVRGTVNKRDVIMYKPEYDLIVVDPANVQVVKLGSVVEESAA